MPVVIPERLVGDGGLAIIEAYSDPRFMFTALTELEDAFVRVIMGKFQDFKADGEVTEPPPIVPAYNPGDRKFYAIVVEAQLNQLSAQGLGKNKFEVEYQPNPDDPNNTDLYLGYSGDLLYTIEVLVRALTRFSVCYVADWVFAALNDPISQGLAGYGIEIPYNAIRFSGRAQELQGPTGKDKFWNITFTIPGITIPWARLYKMDMPAIEEITVEPTSTGIGS